MVGLLVGKTAGISLATWLTLKSGIVQLPRDMGMRHVVGVALLAGIGFTMSMFITELAFGDSPELVTAAKSGILLRLARRWRSRTTLVADDAPGATRIDASILRSRPGIE